MDYEIEDCGKRQKFDSGAVRNTQEGKGRYDLLPFRAIHDLAIHFEKGAKVYGEDNYRKGIPLRRYMDSAARHLSMAMIGKKNENHVIAVAWNILAMIETQHMIEEGLLPDSLDDLPKITDINASNKP